ncbi:MAG: Altered inheritance of mitochondria protein 24, mitochondrial [Candelina mexicana]|nr:MAG: Altered inheritance of mitochondria protein 24, mitochondrial [Candelina mexicana]
MTSFAVVHLDGTVDWMVAQRRALLAWTGHSLSVSPIINRKVSLAHWGNSLVAGRGLLALAGKGQVYQITLKAGDEYVAHPSNVLAYTVTQNPPLPYRLKSSALRFQIPGVDVGNLLPDTKFFKAMRESGTWRAITGTYFTIRTWLRRTIWGDRLFLQFHGPRTVLLQSRASRLSDVLTSRDVNEIADSPAGTVRNAVTLAHTKEGGPGSASSTPKDASKDGPTRLSVASISHDGKVAFKDTDDFKSFSS